MLKKMVLVAALAVASFVSVNLAAHKSSPTTNTVTMKFPPCDPWTGGGCSN